MDTCFKNKKMVYGLKETMYEANIGKSIQRSIVMYKFLIPIYFPWLTFLSLHNMGIH